MDSIISPFQASFVLSQQIRDNIIIGMEIMHIMKKTKRCPGLFAMKIDLEEAYNCIRWDFLKQVLLEASMSLESISLIMNCIKTVSYNVLWNVNHSDFFSPQGGLRQGDPMPPFLFVLCMDRLSHLINDAINSGQ